MAVSQSLQSALDRAESLKTDAQTKVQAVLDAKSALAQAQQADSDAVKSADEASNALDQARQAVLDAATAEFTLSSDAPAPAAGSAAASTGQS